jgi:Methyladenine glycosylase
MPTKLSNFNFFIFQDRDSSVSRPLRVRGILWCRGRVALGSCFRGRLPGTLWGLRDEGIVRNRLTIAAAIQNTKAFVTVRKECGSFDVYLWSFVGGKPIQNRWRTMAKVPARTAESDAMRRDWLRRGFKFAGSTICYTLMQATGMVNDHLGTCPRHVDLGGKR